MGIAFQIGQILWDFISQCEIWHVCTLNTAVNSIWKPTIKELLQDYIMQSSSTSTIFMEERDPQEDIKELNNSMYYGLSKCF